MANFVKFKDNKPVNLDKVTYISFLFSEVAYSVRFVFDSSVRMEYDLNRFNNIEWDLDSEEDFNYVLSQLDIKEL